jgi:hypothetical protein
MNDEQEQATDRAPTEDWAICDRCLKEVPKHRAHSCVKVTIETPDFEVTPERLCSLLYDERRLHKATAARLITSESEVAGLRARLKQIKDSAKAKFEAIEHFCKEGDYYRIATEAHVGRELIDHESMVAEQAALRPAHTQPKSTAPKP